MLKVYGSDICMDRTASSGRRGNCRTCLSGFFATLMQICHKFNDEKSNYKEFI